MKPIRIKNAPALLATAIFSFNASAAFAEDSTSVAVLAKNTHFHGISVDESDSSRIYLATHHGLYIFGADYKAQRVAEVRDYMGFTPHPTDPAILFASGHPAGGGNLGFIASTDGGRSWTKLSDGAGRPVDFHQMDVSKADPNVIYGVYDSLQLSGDGGKTWKQIGKAPDDIISLAASSIDVNTLYAATGKGLQRSTDGGRTWTMEAGQPTTMVHVTHDGTVYAFLIGKGLVRASENNLAWQAVKDFNQEYLLHFAADPRDAKRLYAIAFNSRARSQSVIASRDGGQNWSPVGTEGEKK